MVFPGGSAGKESACNVGDLVSILGWADPLEKGKAAHSSILAWRIPWTEEPGRLQSMGSQRVGHDWVTFTSSRESSQPRDQPRSPTLQADSLLFELPTVV